MESKNTEDSLREQKTEKAGEKMCRMEGVDFAAISPYVRMMRLKKVTTMLSGKWRDIDHVYTYIASGSAEFIIAGVRYRLKQQDMGYS